MKVISNFTARVAKDKGFVDVPPGTEIELPDDEARDKLARGLVSQAPAKSKPPQPETQVKDKPHRRS